MTKTQFMQKAGIQKREIPHGCLDISNISEITGFGIKVRTHARAEKSHISRLSGSSGPVKDLACWFPCPYVIPYWEMRDFHMGMGSCYMIVTSSTTGLE